MGQLSLAADMMRHLYTRQYLGKVVIICEHPAIFLMAAHKHWLKLSRNIQQQRLNTTSADKILKYTHAITHMQHLAFTAKTPLEEPEADVYFVRSDQIDLMPPRCVSVYLTSELSIGLAADILMQLPADALIIDYEQLTPWTKLGLDPKKTLEERVVYQWRQAQTFLLEKNIDTTRLLDGYVPRADRMDNALDTLLGVSHQFLQIANDFNHALELARPMRVGKALRQQYDAFALLAHRVQALSSSSYTQRFLEAYNEEDAFFMYDAKKFFRKIGSESLSEAIARHRQAGRLNLVRALQSIA